MQEGNLVPLVLSIIFIFFVAVATAILLKRMRFPYTIGLVIAGLALGFLSTHSQIPLLVNLQQMKITPDIIMYVLLPALVFDAALNIDSRLLMKNLTPILLLATLGLLLATIVTGFIVSAGTPLAISSALLFGALISATDPVAVIALFKEIGAPRRLTMLVDGESLFNDATAMVAFQILLGIIAAGIWSGSAVTKGVIDFFLVFAGGAIVGAVIAWIMVRVMVLAQNDPLVVTAISTITAYTSFIVANYYLNVSGVMATVGAGMVLNWHSSTKFSRETREYMSLFWKYACFIANSAIFLMIGITENFLVANLLSNPIVLLYILIAVIAVLAARAVVVFGLTPILNRLPKAEPVDMKNQVVMFWGGLRGALPIALAASLSYDFADRNLILQLTCGIVLFTLLVQGSSIRRLMGLIKINKYDDIEKATKLRADITSLNESLQKLDRVKNTWHFPESTFATTVEKYKAELKNLEDSFTSLQNNTRVQKALPNVLWKQALNRELNTYRSLFEHGFISPDVIRELEYQNIIQNEHVDSGETPPLRVKELPLYIRLAQTTAVMLEKLNTGNRILHNRRIRILTHTCEHSIALANACKTVLDRLNHLAGISGAGEDQKDQCRNYYENTMQSALDNLEKMQMESPEHTREVINKIINRIALNARLDTINELLHNGGIPEQIAISIKAEIDTRLTQV